MKKKKKSSHIYFCPCGQSHASVLNYKGCVSMFALIFNGKKNLKYVMQLSIVEKKSLYIFPVFEKKFNMLCPFVQNKHLPYCFE